MTPFRLALLLFAVALCPAPGGRGVASAHDDREPREVREVREVRETREARDAREATERARDDDGHGSRDSGDRDGSHGGGDDRGSGNGSSSGSGGRDGGHGNSRGGSGRRDSDARQRGREPRLEFERDARGAERVRGEVLVVGRPDEVAALESAGYTLLEVSPLGALDAEAARVRVPDGRTLDALVEELRRLLPEASVAADHVFRPSARVADVPAPANAAQPGDASTASLGIVDTGIDPVTPALRAALRETRGFAPGGYVPRPHGTAVGDIAARAGVALVSADAFGLDSDDNLAATTLALAQSVDWLIARRVRVINISIEGPDNPVIARIVRRALDAGIAIVAAAGNSGPSAPPAFPAAYPGVIAVTAVDERGRVYRRANRGAYIAFAARGVNVAIPRRDGGTSRESGTSFAAPLVAAALALRAAMNPAETTSQAVAALARAARDLGAAGRDATFGWGEIELPRNAAAQLR